jgi:sugar phosphate isomerase/epimerase
MLPGSDQLARVLLKARPTPAQLADRFASPWPDGLELYLDRADVETPAECRAVLQRIRDYELPEDFAFVVEGPIRGLDNEYFDLGICSAPTRELVRRLGDMAAELGAAGVIMHCIMPRFTLTDDDWAAREATFESCLEFAEFYADALRPLGVVPVLENVPPVLRMRESRYLYTPLGMAPEDLRWFLDRIPGLMTTLDVSHAQLYVNARRMADTGDYDPSVEPLMRFLRRFAPIESVETFVDVMSDSIFEAHVSNATGLLGEGAPYREGDIDMDRVIGRLARTARFLVTETLEPNNDHAVHMREAQDGMETLIRGLRGQTASSAT